MPARLQWTPDARARFAEMWLNWRTETEISVEFGISRDTVGRTAVLFDLPRRAPYEVWRHNRARATPSPRAAAKAARMRMGWEPLPSTANTLPPLPSEMR